MADMSDTLKKKKVKKEPKMAVMPYKPTKAGAKELARNIVSFLEGGSK